MSRDNRHPYYDDEPCDFMAAYDAYGRLRNLQAEMESSYRRLCDRCGWNYDGTTREDARLENFYAGML